MISTKSVVAGLVAVNVLLGAALFARFGWERTAQAQIGGGQPFHVVGGVVKNLATIFVYDPGTGTIGVVQCDPSKNNYIVLDRLPVNKDMAALK